MLSSARFFLLPALAVFAACGGLNPPPTFIRTVDEPGTWRTIEVREGLNQDEKWRTTIDGLTRSFDIEVLDKESGYARTSWKYTYFVNDEVVDRYRSRIIVKFQGAEWLALEVKSEANWLSDNGWVMGYDTRLLEDAYGDLQGRIGRVRR